MGNSKKGRSKSRAKTEPTPDEIMKYEITSELGLLDKVNLTGWKSLTAKESGRIGGLMAKRKKMLDGNE